MSSSCNSRNCSTLGSSLLQFLPTESAMLSNYLICCHLLLLMTSLLCNIRVFSKGSPFHIRWPNMRASASVFSVNVQGWFPLGLTGLMSLRSKGLTSIFSYTTIRNHQFFGAQPPLWSNFHICKEFTCQCRRCGFDPWVRKILWGRKWQPTPVFLPGKSHGQRSLVGYSPRGHKDSDTAKYAHMHSYPYVTTGKTIALTIQTFVSKVMSLPFNTLSRLVIAFLPRSKRLLISWLHEPSAEILEPKKQNLSLLPLFPLLLAMKRWDWMPWSLFFECWISSQLFSLSYFTPSRCSLVPLHFLPLECYHLHMWGCWSFSPKSWFQLENILMSP